MTDNTSANDATAYDDAIVTQLPYVGLFYQSAIDVVRAAVAAPHRWLDTGCGTGTLCALAKSEFPNVEFTLADPSQPMLDVARAKLGSTDQITYSRSDSSSLAFTDGSFDVITAIQCHHYLDEPARAATTRNCWRMLRPGGLYVEFENIRPLTPQGLQIGMQMWTTFQSNAGRTPDQITQHTNRFDTAYFPLTIPQHLELLKQSGFSAAEVLWASHLQAGFYAVK